MPEDLAGYAELRRQLAMPIAGGENEQTPFGFGELLAAGAVDVAPPSRARVAGARLH